MMSMASDGAGGRDGTRIGLWGAAQAIAFALGGLAGAAAVDLARLLIGDAVMAYAAVFALQAALFLASAAIAAWIRIERPEPRDRTAVAAAPVLYAGE
jgi:MFS transporter, BCD family, chlorophyll transporter